MVVPITLAQPQMGTVLGLKAFVIPIIAGPARRAAYCFAASGMESLRASSLDIFSVGSATFLDFL
jgi:hypothetical protein